MSTAIAVGTKTNYQKLLLTVIVVGATIGAIVAVVNSGSSSNDSTPTPAPLPPGSTRSPTSQPVEPGSFLPCTTSSTDSAGTKMLVDASNYKKCVYIPDSQCDMTPVTFVVAEQKCGATGHHVCTFSELKTLQSDTSYDLSYNRFPCGLTSFRQKKCWLQNSETADPPRLILPCGEVSGGQTLTCTTGTPVTNRLDEQTHVKTRKNWPQGDDQKAIPICCSGKLN